MNVVDEKDLNFPLEWPGQRKKSLKFEIGDTFWTGVSCLNHCFGDKVQGWKIFTSESELSGIRNGTY